MAARSHHQRLSAATGGKDVSHQGRAVPISHPHWHNHQQDVYKVTPPRGCKRDSSVPWATLVGIAPPLSAALKGKPGLEGTTCQPYASYHLSPPALRSNGYCPLQVWNSTRCLSEMVNSKLTMKKYRSEVKD